MESLRNNLPLISLCLLIIGTLNLLVYYDYFEINILSYLDLTEVFQLQFRFFAVSVLSLLGFLFYMLLTPSRRPNPHEVAAQLEAERQKALVTPTVPESAEGAKDETDVKVIAKKIQEKDVPFTAMCAFGAFVLIANWWSGIRREQSTLVHTLMWVELGLFIVLLYFTYIQIQKNFINGHFPKESASNISRKMLLVNVLLVLAFAASVRAREDAMDVIAMPSYFEVTTRLEDTTLVTNINYRFVGKTKNNIFFYDVKKHQAEVYSTDKMKSFVVKDRRKL